MSLTFGHFLAALKNYDTGMDLRLLIRNEEALDLNLKAHAVNLELLSEHSINTSYSYHILSCILTFFRRNDEAMDHLQKSSSQPLRMILLTWF